LCFPVPYLVTELEALKHDDMGTKPTKTDEPRINREIRTPRVRVIAEDGEQLGILDIREAVYMAEDRGLDLVEVSPQARPPVCKLMDWGRYKYAQKKKVAEAKKTQHQMQFKEIKMRPKTDAHDLETKVKHARRFLEENDGVKLTMRFRGREIIYAERAMETLHYVAQQLSEISQIRSQPSLEGRNMYMVLVPGKKAN
jgi:translation initiation factor IF-3